MTHKRNRSLRSTRRRRSDRGSAFIEFALVVPLLTLLAMGLAEYGMAWTETNQVNAAARDAARAGTSASAYHQADLVILRQLAVSLNKEQRNNVQRIVVFKAAGLDGKVPQECLDVPIPIGGGAPPFGVPGKCNVYNWGVLESIRIGLDQHAGNLPSGYSTYLFDNGTGCTSPVTTWDADWCPTDRKNDMDTNNMDYLGVYLQIKHQSLSGAFGDQMIARKAIFRLEPKAQY